MTTFDQRGKGFEAGFAADQQTRFVVHVRQSKLIGLWAARKMGLTATEAEAYAKTLVRADVEKTGQDDVVNKIAADLAQRGIAASDNEIRGEMDRFLPEAQRAEKR
jgi:hypothetical protein